MKHPNFGKLRSVLGPVVILGKDGMLSRAWQRILNFHNIKYIAWPKEHLNRLSTSALREILSTCHDSKVVINCTGYTNVDMAEEDFDAAYHLNATGVMNIGRLCAEGGFKLVHYSTDHVFTADSPVSRTPSSSIKPVNAYALSKAAGELNLELLETQGLDQLTIRTACLYDLQYTTCFMRYLYEDIVEGCSSVVSHPPTVSVVGDDMVINPTSTDQLVYGTLMLLQEEVSGIDHVTGFRSANWAQIAQHIKDVLNISRTVNTLRREDMTHWRAVRPWYSYLQPDRKCIQKDEGDSWKNELTRQIRIYELERQHESSDNWQ